MFFLIYIFNIILKLKEKKRIFFLMVVLIFGYLVLSRVIFGNKLLMRDMNRGSFLFISLDKFMLRNIFITIIVFAFFGFVRLNVFRVRKTDRMLRRSKS